MSNSISSPRAGPSPSHWEPKFPFDLVVAYEDTLTRNRALHLYDHLAQQLLDDYDFQCSWWKFDLLSDSTLHQKSADASAEANMVILSLHARPELTPAQKAWLDSWLPRRDGRKSALVVIVAGTEEEVRDAESMLIALRRAARLARMDFFNHTFDLRLPSRGISLVSLAPSSPSLAPLPSVAPAPSQPTAPPSPPASPSLLYHQIPTPRWGINE